MDLVQILSCFMPRQLAQGILICSSVWPLSDDKTNLGSSTFLHKCCNHSYSGEIAGALSHSWKRIHFLSLNKWQAYSTILKGEAESLVLDFTYLTSKSSQEHLLEIHPHHCKRYTHCCCMRAIPSFLFIPLGKCISAQLAAAPTAKNWVSGAMCNGRCQWVISPISKSKLGFKCSTCPANPGCLSKDMLDAGEEVCLSKGTLSPATHTL